jgi:hypothetical protein
MDMVHVLPIHKTFPQLQPISKYITALHSLHSTGTNYWVRAQASWIHWIFTFATVTYVTIAIHVGNSVWICLCYLQSELQPQTETHILQLTFHRIVASLSRNNIAWSADAWKIVNIFVLHGIKLGLLYWTTRL